MTERVEIIISATDNASKVFGGVANAAQKAFAGVGKSIQNAGKGISDFGLSLAQWTAPLAIVGGMGIKVFSDFETVMAEIEARTGATGEQMDKVKQKALDMGAATAFSGTEAANAMLELLASGFSLEETFTALPAVLNAAAAGNLDLGYTADVVTDALAMFNLKAEDSTRVVDALSAGAGASSADIDSLAQGLGNVGPIAAEFNLSIEDTVGILAAFSERGIKGAEAGTQLKSMLVAMTKTTPKVTSMWKSLGIELFTATGAMRPLETIMNELSVAMDGMSDKERINTLKTLGGSYGQLGLSVLTSSDAMGDMNTLMAKQTDAATVAAARMDTLAGRTESLMGSVETLMINALEPLIENTLKPMIVQATGVVNMINAWAKANPKLVTQITKLAAKLVIAGPILFVVGKGITLIGIAIATLFNPVAWLIGAFVLLGGPRVLGKVVDALGELWTALMSGGAASVQFQTTLVSIFGSELGNQIFFIVNNLLDMVNILSEMGIAGITTLQFWGELNDIFGSELGNRLHELAVSFFELWLNLKLFVNDVLIPFVSQHAGTLIGIFTKIAAVLAGAAIAGAILSIGASIAALVNPITLTIGAIVLLWTAWKSNFGGIRTFMTGTVWPAIKPILEDIIDLLEIAIPDAIDTTLKAWEQLKILVPLAMQVILAFWENQLKPGIDGMVTAWEGLKVIVEIAWDNMKNIIDLAILAINAFWEHKLKPGIDDMSTAWQGLKAIVDLAWAQMKVLIDLGIAVIVALWENILKPKIDAMKTAWNNLKTRVETVWTGIKTAVTNAINPIIDVIQTLVDWIGKIDLGILGEVAGFFGGVIGGGADLLGFAGGGAFQGLASVGEEGRELVYAPGGAMVIPNGQSEQIINNFNLTTNSASTSAGVESDFRMMEAFAG